MPRIFGPGADPLAPQLPANPVPERIVQRVSAAEAAIEELYDVADPLINVGENGEVLTADNGAAVWDAIPS